MAPNCECDNPKSTTRCENDQMAICREVNGRCWGKCYSRPKGLSVSNPQVLMNWVLEVSKEEERERNKEIVKEELNILSLMNWALGIIKEEEREENRKITKDELEILSSGTYEFISDTGDKVKVKFTLPIYIM